MLEIPDPAVMICFRRFRNALIVSYANSIIKEVRQIFFKKWVTVGSVRAKMTVLSAKMT